MSDSPARIRGTNTSIETAAKQLRKTQTPAEKILWQTLRGGRLAGLKFRRQHPVGNFILDFYCPTYKLAIEVDGSIHQTQIVEDAARTTQLEAYGYTVLRFSNAAVIAEIDAVLVEILQAVDALSPSPSPKSGQGEQESDPSSPRLGQGEQESDPSSPRLGQGEQESDPPSPRLGRATKIALRLPQRAFWSRQGLGDEGK